MQISVAVILGRIAWIPLNEEKECYFILWLSCCHMLSGMCSESEELNATEVSVSQWQHRMVKKKKKICCVFVCVHTYKHIHTVQSLLCQHTLMHAHTHTYVYLPVHSSSGLPTCWSHHPLSLEHGKWRSRCQAEDRWTCQCWARSSYLHWSPRHQILVFHFLRAAYVGPHKRRFWECKARENSHLDLDLGAPVALVCQEVPVPLEGQGSLEAHVQTLSSSQKDPGAVEIQLSAPAQAEMYCGGHIPSCRFPAFRNGSLHFRCSSLWLCGPAGEWRPTV